MLPQNDVLSTPAPEILTVNSTAPLRREQWLEAVKAAKDEIKAGAEQPRLDEFLRASAPRYPAWLTKLTGVLLAFIAGGALFVSAGKQLAAADVVLTNVADHSARVSAFWVSVGLIVLLLVGEVGALVFSLSASIFGRSAGARRVLRAFAYASASIALVANVSMTLAYPTQDVWLFQILVTVLPPSFVLGVGLTAENMLMQYLEARAAAVERFELAMARFQAAQTDPEKHPDYWQVLPRHVIQAVRAAQPAMRRKNFDATLQADPAYELSIITREVATNTRDYASLLGNIANAPAPAPALNAGALRDAVAGGIVAGVKQLAPTGGGEVTAGVYIGPAMVVNQGFSGFSEKAEKAAPAPQPERLQPAVARAVEWLIENPQYQGESLAVMVAASGMTQATLSRARAFLRGQQ